LRKLRKFLFVFVVVVLLAITSEVFAEDYVLPAGLQLTAVLQEELYSQRNKPGDEVLFVLANDVYVGNQIVLVQGTPVLGRVSRQKAAKGWGRSGKIEIEIVAVNLPYSRPVPVTGVYGESASPKTGKVITTYALCGLFLAGGVKGEKITIPYGTEVVLYVQQDTMIDLISVEEMRMRVDKWMKLKVTANFLSFSYSTESSVKSVLAELYGENGYRILVFDLSEYDKLIVVRVLSDGTSFDFHFKAFNDMPLKGWKYKNVLVPLDKSAKKVMKKLV